MTREHEQAINELQRMKMDKSHTGSEYNAIMTAIQAIKNLDTYREPYNKGYEDGVKATNVDCGVVWKERIDAIKQEIREAKSDNHAGGVLFIEQAYDICLAIIDEHCVGDNE